MALLCTIKPMFMKRRLLIATTLSLIVAAATAQQHKDSTRNYTLDEVVVRASTKETNNMWKMPSATSLITPAKILNRGIESLKDISTLVPNLYIPDYGSKMTTPLYLRGIGTRSSGQSVAVYVDNIPYMDKSTLDFELMDIQRIEVLRGPQGTLYGRNAMGGIINIYTLSPIDYQGTKISIGAANYGTYAVKASNYSKISSRVGISVAGYYDRSDGYFTNEFTGKKVDKEQSAGGRLKLDWRLTDRLLMNFETSFDYTDQGAFAYGLYDRQTEVVNPVNYNDEGSYRRSMSNNNLRFEYKTPKVLISSNTGFQYLDDDMRMDQDFTEKSIFTINQRQRQSSFSQEFTARSLHSKNYQWSVGAFGFYNDMRTTGDVVFKEDGIKTILQPVFDKIAQSNPRAPKFVITDTEIPNPGTYKTPTWGVSLFHQSTFNNILTKGLSATIGLRFDYERQYLGYNTSILMNIEPIKMAPGMPPISKLDKELIGGLHQDNLQVLPKLSIKYECSPDIMTYATVSKGYKAGGYNVQMFSEVIQKALNPMAKPVDIATTASYRPELTWNYELGMRADLIGGILRTELALFYMDIADLQLTQFVDGGSGRILSNAGHGESYGVEVAVSAAITPSLTLDANYGFTKATFTDYDDGKTNYKGNFIPYTPRNTFSVGATYSLLFGKKFIEQLSFTAAYNGCGTIYWTEMNDIKQPFYGLLNAKVSVRHRLAKLELWAKNITSTNYGAFYFESFGNSFVQRGKPFTIGANLILTF